MKYQEQPTEFLEEEYKRLCYMNTSWLSKDIVQTVRDSTDKIAMILYHRQHIREMEERKIDIYLNNLTNHE